MSGYQNPPKHTQFKPGQSGNPKGRPRGSHNKSKEISNLIHDVFNKKAQKQSGTTITIGEALVLSMVKKAMNGDVSAFKALVTLYNPDNKSAQNEDINVSEMSLEEASNIYKQVMARKPT